MRIRKTKKRKEGDSAYKPVVPALEQALEILLLMAESSNSKMGLTEICSQIGIHKSKGYSILHTLMEYGFAEKDKRTKTYSLGPNLLFLSRNVLDNLYYPNVVAPFLESLAKETNETAMFGLISGSHVFVLNQREGNGNIVFRLRLGQRFHITLGAHGKAIMAFLPEAEREAILSKKKLYFHGDPSRFEMGRLREEFARCGETGFAYDIGEVTPGVTVISAPVFGFGEKLIGCIGLIGAYPQGKIQKNGAKLTGVAKEISHKLGAYSGTVSPVQARPMKIKKRNGGNILRVMEGVRDASS